MSTISFAFPCSKELKSPLPDQTFPVTFPNRKFIFDFPAPPKYSEEFQSNHPSVCFVYCLYGASVASFEVGKIGSFHFELR